VSHPAVTARLESDRKRRRVSWPSRMVVLTWNLA